ncbi:hypothetical protein BUALT_Bualt03G0069300 [Buddleja alternifolia]|uniref:Uncharacterized protein n=1 Tax=Buddleja alternifolia TaxID=168488 RepID=A0AAV6XW08_9LAMI|nr:hypothetical protein BUALT_Bualt03G0069300 [Buddleja alternifolia]
MAVLSWLQIIYFVHVFLSTLISIIDARNALGPHQVLKIGQTLISDNNRFELGFFHVSPSKDSNQDLWYLGIWYKGIKSLTLVWVANRAKPLRGIDIKLLFNSAGEFLIQDEPENVICLARLSQPVSRASLVLLDSGNLVIIKNGQNFSDENNYLWQSFDSPSDTLLPGMKLGWDLRTQIDRSLTSWKTSDDPSYGDFIFSIESPKSPQLLLEKNGKPESRWGPWDGKRFSGIDMKDNPVFRLIYHSSLEEVYFTFEMLDDSILLRLVVNSAGTIQFLRWKNSSMAWVPMVTLKKDECDGYGSCGPYGVCYPDYLGCRCLKGFMANSPHEWLRMDYTDGCRRKNALNCSDGDGFVKYKGLKLPDNFTVLWDLSSSQCVDYCLKECGCMAYTNIDVYGNGSVCVVWLDKLVDIREYTHGGDELYIRMARVELEAISHKERKRNVTLISSILLAALLGMALLWCAKEHFISLSNKAKKKELENRESLPVNDDDQDIPLFDMKTISAATNNFCFTNKIGQGGFGPVYQAWKLWIERRDMELIDPVLAESLVETETKRCIQIGLLCVQHSHDERPMTDQVVSMLESEDVKLPEPQEPGFFSQRSTRRFGSYVGWDNDSVNGLTVTTLTARA